MYERFEQGEKNVQNQPVTPGLAMRWTLAILAIFLLLGVLGVGGCAGMKSYSRYQQRADKNQNRQQKILDEKNNIQVNNIRIAQTQQLVKVAQQTAQIRYENAVGIRKAQDEISSTLTPLYVQFEMVQTLQEIAKSGRNNSVIFIPTGPDGRPIASPQINAIHPQGGTP